MSEITRICLDVDDVCNRFTMPILASLGCPVDPLGYDGFPVECGYDILAAAKHYGHEISKTKFWDSITRDVWAGLPESAEFRPLLDHCERLVGLENTYILTSPTLDPECLAGKLDWIQEHFPRVMQRNFMIGPPKELCARPSHLLIDDRDDNVDKFRREGGHTILVPRPWNRLHNYATLPYIENALKQKFDHAQASL